MFWSYPVTYVYFGKEWVDTFEPDVFTFALLTEGVLLHPVLLRSNYLFPI